MIESAWTRGVAMATLLSMAGCYRYIPSEPAAVAPGQRVRVFVTREALVGLGDLPMPEGSALNGTLVRAEPARLVLRLPVATRQTGFSVEVLGQDVFIPTEQVLQVERREVNRPFTALLAVGATGLLAGLVVLIIGEAIQGEQHPGSGDVELRAPLP
ncbi:MAG: hypothetical protein EXR95_03605 [Gemmatimonadetes bacterium]|nr:hypothetical protein [Gemmatimonadota bacterium]